MRVREPARGSALVALAIGVLAVAAAAATADEPPRVIVFGAHPDDCDMDAGGTAALWAARGYAVKFVSLTNGDAGHQSEGGGALAQRRRAEAQEAGRRLGIAEYEVLDNHDGELEPTLAVRQEVIRRIRRWNADVVVAPRPNDYHPDHRYTAILVQDAAYMVVVPNVCPDTPALRKNPVFLYTQDHFQRPNPFRPDVAVAIDSVIEKKIHALGAHVSQVYEWLPWVDGALDSVPKEPEARLLWLREQRSGHPIAEEVRTALRRWYGPPADTVREAEAFEICEYGRRPTEADLRRIFPFFGTPPIERVALPPVPLREVPSLLESSPAGWTDVQPGPDLAGWVRGAWPATATLGTAQWLVEPASGHLVCDGKGGHEWLRYDRELGDAVFHVEWRFTPLEGAEKYNSGVLARTVPDLSFWHQAQVGLAGGFLFGVTPVDGVAKRLQQEPAARRVLPAGEWNTYEVVARGRMLSLWVNGAFTSELAVDVPRGYFGLEAEGWRIEFRNLKVRALD